MIKLNTILAGTALAMFSQFAAAQVPAGAPAQTVVPAASAPSNPNDPAYTDQSRLNRTNDPYVKKRVADKEAKTEYKAEKKAAKDEYKADKKAAKTEYKAEKKDAKQEYKAEKKDARATRKDELKDMRQTPAIDPVTGKPSTMDSPVVPGTTR